MKMFMSKITSIEEIAQNANGQPETIVYFYKINFTLGACNHYSFKKRPQDIIQGGIIYFTEEENEIEYKGTFNECIVKLWERFFPALTDKNLIVASIQLISKDFKTIYKESFYGVFGDEKLIDFYSGYSIKKYFLEEDFKTILSDLENVDTSIKRKAMVETIYPYKNLLVSKDTYFRIHNDWEEKENPWIKITKVSPIKNTSPDYIYDFYQRLIKQTGIKNLFHYIDDKEENHPVV